MPKPHKNKKKVKVKSQKSSDSVDDALTLLLETAGLRVLSVEGDGNCLFRAFSYEVNGDESTP